ncbi:MAG: helix-turn-helix transcriptional regulator [Armatimonadetes bacterium]|nr:helix-turn-helix transcriptional regulator [Armatimonadota bacterium]
MRAYSLDEIIAEQMQRPEVRAEYERTAVASAVSIWLVGYRARHELTQRGLAKKLGMSQAAIARLERGDIEPKLSTLMRLSSELGIELHVVLQGRDLRVSEAA